MTHPTPPAGRAAAPRLSDEQVREQLAVCENMNLPWRACANLITPYVQIVDANNKTVGKLAYDEVTANFLIQAANSRIELLTELLALRTRPSGDWARLAAEDIVPKVQAGTEYSPSGRERDGWLVLDPQELRSPDFYSDRTKADAARSVIVDSWATAILARAPRADGAMREALEGLVKKCRCGGTGFWTTDCTLCGDSTFDHYCNDETVKCERPECVAARAALAAEPTRDGDEARLRLHPKTADGVVMSLDMPVWIVRSMAGWDEPGWGHRPLNIDKEIVSARVASIGMLGSERRQRAGYIERGASFTITANREAVFSTEAAALAARRQEGGA